MSFVASVLVLQVQGVIPARFYGFQQCYLGLVFSILLNSCHPWWSKILWVACGFPGVPYACCFSVRYGHGVDGVGVLVVEHKDIVIPTAGGSCLV